MPHRSSRRSFLTAAGLGAAAMGAEFLAARRRTEPFRASNRRTPQDHPPELGSRSRTARSAWESSAMVSADSAPSSRCNTIPTPTWSPSAICFPTGARLWQRNAVVTKTYPSLEEMVKDDSIEAIFVATDAPSHARHCIEVLRHGKHVATAVPAAWELWKKRTAVRDRQELRAHLHDVRDLLLSTRTVCHAPDLPGRWIRETGLQRRRVFSQWRRDSTTRTKVGGSGCRRNGIRHIRMPIYCGVTDGSFTEVSCMGMPSIREELKPENNRYQNPFGTEIALLRTSEGGMARMACSWDTPGHGGEMGRVRGQRGSMIGMDYQGDETNLPDLARPPLPPAVDPGGHGGSHGYLGHEFLMAILESRQPLVDIAMALNMTVAGIVAHQSALYDGQLMKIPQYRSLA